MKLRVVNIMELRKNIKLDLGRNVRNTQFFNEYLKYLSNVFEMELENEMDLFGDIIYNLEANIYSRCKIYKSSCGKLMIDFALPSGIEYSTIRRNEDSSSPEVCQMLNYQRLAYPSKKITINYDFFLKALHSNGFSSLTLMDDDDLEMINNGKLPYLKTELTVSKSHLDIPVETQRKNAIKRLNLRREYPDNSKKI